MTMTRHTLLASTLALLLCAPMALAITPTTGLATTGPGGGCRKPGGSARRG